MSLAPNATHGLRSEAVRTLAGTLKHFRLPKAQQAELEGVVDAVLAEVEDGSAMSKVRATIALRNFILAQKAERVMSVEKFSGEERGGAHGLAERVERWYLNSAKILKELDNERAERAKAVRRAPTFLEAQTKDPDA